MKKRGAVVLTTLALLLSGCNETKSDLQNAGPPVTSGPEVAVAHKMTMVIGDLSDAWTYDSSYGIENDDDYANGLAECLGEGKRTDVEDQSVNGSEFTPVDDDSNADAYSFVDVMKSDDLARTDMVGFTATDNRNCINNVDKKQFGFKTVSSVSLDGITENENERAIRQKIDQGDDQGTLYTDTLIAVQGKYETFLIFDNYDGKPVSASLEREALAKIYERMQQKTSDVASTTA